ncbi:hypothetical protein AWW67_09470 [Roseivirga seohaensis]|uniref:DUF304 domain-containing protein n=1 Tax=Roseivirga seohaensis TaxID=1914963 RepID=A0A150XNS5_9BACT|nr:hypothetical protein [Roseivirga seohaensis]KYG80398.1 hypothetical protein AWW67_09470 [Roseivirga seohaensis]
MNHHFLDRTNNFSKPSVWFGRAFIALILIIQLFIWEFEAPYEYIRYILTIIILLATVLARKADIAVDREYFYFLNTSILPQLSKTRKFKISELTSIRGRSYDSSFLAFYYRKSLQGLDYGIEMTFKDEASDSLDVNIYKIELERILSKVRELMTA